MKTIIKAVSVFLVALMVAQLLPLTTMAEEYNEELEREEYLRENLSDYLYDLVDTKDITEILQPEPYISQDNPYGSVLTLKNKQGENVSYIFSEPVAFFDTEGKMQYKEIGIERQTDAKTFQDGYAYTNGTNDYRINFAEAATTGIQVQKDSVSWYLSVNQADKNTTGELLSEKVDNKDVGVFSYENAFGHDTILKYYPQLNGVKEDIVLNSYNGVNEFSFSLVVENGYAVLNTDNTVTIHNKTTGKIVDTFTPPYACDSIEEEDENSPAQHYVDCEYSLEEVGEGEYLFSIIVPKAFLEADTTVYPVIIDPTTSYIYQSLDTPVYSGYPSGAYSSNVMNCFGRASDYGYGRVLTKFTIPSAINNYATISSAYLWVRELTGRTGTTYVRPYMNTSSFTSSTTWNTKPSYDTNTSMSNKNINSNSQDGGPSVYWYKFNIAYAVRNWTTGTTNNGLSFISNEETNGEYNWRGFASAEHGTSSYHPYAVITYTNDTTAPTITSVTGNPTSWTKSNVTLTVNATDNASGVKKYSFDNGSTWQTGNTKSFSSNQTVYIKVKDYAGNVSSASTVVISKIDKTDPSITSVTQDPSSWTNGSITLTVNATDNASGVAYYSFDNGSNWQASASKAFSSNQTVNIKVKDAAGNVSAKTTVTISKIDKTKPTISSVDGNPSTWTNQNVTLTVNATDAASGVTKYSFDDGSTWQTSNSKAFSSNQTVNIKVKDAAGNVSAKTTVTISKIDKTKPTISSVDGNPSTWTNQNVTLTVNATDAASGVTKYSFDDGSTWQTSNSKSFSSNQTVSIKVKDAAGNVSAKTTVTISKIDKTKPTISSVDGNPSAWTNQNVTLTVNATDAASGVTKYSFDDGSTWQTSNSKAFSGNQTVNIKVKDAAGNVSAKTTVTISKIDKAKPTISTVDGNPSAWTNQNVTLTVTATDPASGVAYYSFDNGSTWQTANTKSYSSNQTVNIKVKDDVGNISTATTVTINKIDKTKPTISSVDGNPSAWTNQNVTLTVNATDAASGVTKYSFDNGSTWQTANTKSYSSNQTVNIKVKDNAGNISNATTVTINKIDKTKPTISSVDGNPSTWTNQNVTLTVTAADAASGVAYYSFDNGSTWQTSNSMSFSSNQTVNIKVKDSVGNISDATTVTINKIDKTKPTISSVDGNPSTWTNQNVTLTVTAADAASGVAYYSFDNGSTWQTSNSMSFSSNQTVNVKVKDSVGNISDATTITIEYIDKTAPVVPYGFVSGDTLEICQFDSVISLSDEHLQYSIGNNENWETYSSPVRIVCTEDTVIYIKAKDDAHNETLGTSVEMKANVGVYSSVKDDLRNGDFMLPSGFIRTYDGNTKDWFFAFNANIQSECNGKALKYTDFTGTSTYYIQHNDTNRYYSQSHAKIVRESGNLTIGNQTLSYLYYCKYNDAKLYFNSAGKLAAVISGDQKVWYAWGDTALTICDIFGRTYTVVLNDGKPTSVTDCANHTVTYTWANGKLTAATNALYHTETYTYDTDGRLTQNGSETVSYTADGRTAQITQQNGSFLKYTYDDSYSYYSWILLTLVYKYGKVQIADSRGVYTYVKYADGFSVGEALDYEAENTEYAGSFADVPQMQTVLSGTAFLNKKLYGAIFNFLYTYEGPIQLLDDTHYVYYDYDENDNIIGAAIVEFDDESDLAESYTEALSLADYKIQNTYTNGLLTESISFEKVNDSWGYVSRDTYTYTSLGQISSHAQFTIKEGAWGWDSFYTYTYDVYGNPDTTAYYEPPENSTGYVPSDPINSAKTMSETTETTYNIIRQLLLEDYSGSDSQYVNSYVYDALGRTISVTHDSEVTLYTYDAVDNILSQTRGNDVETFVYTNGNLTTYSSSGGDITTYTYDQYGNLTEQAFDIYTLSYNTLGSLLSAEVNSNEIVNYEYAGTSQNVTKETYANNQEVNYNYTDGKLTSVLLGATPKYNYAYTLDNDNNVTQTVITDNAGGLTKTVTDSLTSVSSGNNFLYSVENKSLDEEDENSFNGKVYTVGNAEYTLVAEENKDTFIHGNTEYEKTYTYADDKLTGIGYTGIFSSTYTYNNNDLISSLTHMLSGINKGYGYTYDSNGNITSETQTVTQNNVTTSETINYSYDGKSQLVSAENDSVKWTYTYDNRGNILTKSEYSISLDGNNQKVYTLIDMDTFNYTNSAWQDELTSYNNQTIAYDAAGNPTNYRGNTLTWTMGRQLASYGNTAYTYNEEGIRTSKTANNVTTRYYLDGTNIIAQTDSTNTLYFRYDSNDEIVGLTYLGADYFYVKNQMGDIMGISDTNGNLVAAYEYDPWGAVISAAGSNTALANANPFRYRSYYYDCDTGMYYLQSRYYDPEICRFINADDVEFIGINLISYCNNNPVNNDDYYGFYSPKDAQKYADKWWNGFNIAQYKTNPSDCANFVSQCLYAGKLSKMTGLFSFGWHHYKIANLFQISDAWGKAPSLYKWLIKNNHVDGKIYKIKTIKELNNALRVLHNKPICSCAIFFDWDGDGIINHAALSGEITGYTVIYKMYYYAHSKQRAGKPYPYSSPYRKEYQYTVNNTLDGTCCVYIFKLK